MLILGPPVIEAEGQTYRPARRMVRLLLGMLALRANQPVSTDLIIEGLWPGTPPRSAAANVRSHVAELRRVLHAEVRIHTAADGYVLVAPVDGVDSLVFQRLLADGRRSRAAGEHQAAADRFGSATALWRGRVLDGLAVPDSLAADVVALDEQRLAAYEELTELWAALDRSDDAVPLLRGLVAEHPFRERFWAQLMLALHRTSRTGEALDAYHRLGRLLEEELGMAPQADLTDLYERMRRGQAIAVRGGPPPACPDVTPPRQLPPDAGHLVGRDGPLAELDALLGGGARLAVITGIAGVGKSALGVRWAHTRAEHFPDGQLHGDFHGDLHGNRPDGSRGAEVVAGFLRALGVPASRVPVAVEDAIRLYRSLLADRRVLVVLDNAANAEQVRALRPAGPDCAVLVTSRQRLSGLVARDDALRISLDPLAAKDSVDLLRLVVGARAVSEPDAVARIADLCGRLPLALRIAGARLADEPATRLADFARLLEAGTRLTVLDIADDPVAGVRATFELSYAALHDRERAVFRALGLHPGTEAGAPVLAAMTGLGPADTAAALAVLGDGHLVTEIRPGRYAMHDLLRLYAVERAGAELTSAERAAVFGACFDWYHRIGHAAATIVQPQMVRLPAPPGDPGPDAPAEAAGASEWLAEESENAVAAIAVAHAAGHDRYAWLLADVLQGQFRASLTMAQWRDGVCRGLAAARGAGDTSAIAAMLRGNGSLLLKLGDRPGALAAYREALGHYTELDRPADVCALHNNIGMALAEDQQLRESETELRAALRVAERTGAPAVISTVLANLAILCDHNNLGRLTSAAAYATRSIDLARAAGGGPQLLGRLLTRAEVLAALADRDAAAVDRAEAIAVAESTPLLLQRPEVLDRIAHAHLADDRPRTALELAQRALALVRKRESPSEEAAVHNTLGEVLARLEHPAASTAHFADALRLAESTGAVQARLLARTGLAANLVAADPARAAEHVRAVLATAEQHHMLVVAADAHLALAAVGLRTGDRAVAGGHVRAASALIDRSGYRAARAECDRLAGLLTR